MTVQFRILGPLEVLRDGAAVQPTSPKQRLLLAVLLVHANEVVSVDTLVDALWRGRPPATAGGVLQNYVSQLRKSIEVGRSRGDAPRVLVTAEPGYRLAVGSENLDAAFFERLLAKGRAAVRDGRPALAGELLREGLGLWRGSALVDVADEDPVHREAVRLDALRIAAIEERVEADIAVGRHGDLVEELSQLVATYPLRERIWAQLMLCLYRTGRQADALGAYQTLRRRLAEELGLEPGSQLAQLEHDILSHASSLDWSPSRVPAKRKGGRREPAIGSNLPGGPVPLQFVGRVEEMDELWGWWRDAGSAARLMVVSGEAGVGKTRLVTEFAGEVEGAGVPVLYGRALEAGGSSYEPVLGALRQFFLSAESDVIDALDDTAAGAVCRLVPEMVERRPELAARAWAWGEVDRAWLLGAVAGCMAGPDQSPILLVLDDLQWAGQPALLLLSRLVEPDKRVRVLGTYREPTGPHTNYLADFFAELRRDDRPLRRVSLVGLAGQDVVALMTALAGAELPPAGRAFAWNLHRRTDGNPFFIRETLRQLQDSGAISVAHGRWASNRPLDELGIPDGVKAVVGQRLSHLSSGTGDTLRAAAVVGPGFEVDVVAAVVGRDEDMVVGALEEASAAGLVHEDPPRVDRYGFVHALVHEVLLAELSLSRRARLERRTGEALEALRPAELDERATELARHFAEGVAVGDARKAADWSLRAGARAMERLAYEEAVRCYQMALRVLQLSRESSGEEQADVLIAVGRAANRAGNPQLWRASCLEAASVARWAGDPERLARAAISLLGTLGPGAADDLVAALMEEAAASLRASEISPARQTLLAELLARLSGYLTNSRPDRSAEVAEEAVQTARQAGGGRSLALALMYSTQTYALERDEHQARLREAARLAEQEGDPEVVLAAKSNLMAGALTWADREEFDRRLAEYALIAEATGSPTPLLLSAMDHAGAAALDGRYEDALGLFSDALHRSRSLGDSNHPLAIQAGMAPVNRELGRLGQEVELARHQLATMPAIPPRAARLAWVLCEAGQLDEATALLRTTIEKPEALRMGPLRRYSLGVLTEAAGSLADTDAASRLYKWLEEELRSGECVIVGPHAYFGAVRRYLGLLALTLGRPQEAVAHHQAALDVHERMRARGWSARSRYDLARALLARHDVADIDRAARLIDDAMTAARLLRMPKLLEEVSPWSQEVDQIVRNPRRPGVAGEPS